jgi:antitoxin (DNA-binding transcriptional repressor) of toxin-antitoxin stability system
VAQGEEFTITKHGKPVARLLPVAATKFRSDVRQIIEELKAFNKGNTLGKGMTIRQLIDEGRRLRPTLRRRFALDETKAVFVLDGKLKTQQCRPVSNFTIRFARRRSRAIKLTSHG